MKDIENMSMKEICRHNVNLLTAWNEKNIEDEPEQALKNAAEIFKFYLNGCTTNHVVNQLKGLLTD